MSKKMLNKTLGTLEYDGLIYDGRHPIDVKTVKIKEPAKENWQRKWTNLVIGAAGTGGDDTMA